MRWVCLSNSSTSWQFYDFNSTVGSSDRHTWKPQYIYGDHHDMRADIHLLSEILSRRKDIFTRPTDRDHARVRTLRLLILSLKETISQLQVSNWSSLTNSRSFYWSFWLVISACRVRRSDSWRYTLSWDPLNRIDEPVGVEDHICKSFLSLTKSFRSLTKAQILVMDCSWMSLPWNVNAHLVKIHTRSTLWTCYKTRILFEKCLIRSLILRVLPLLQCASLLFVPLSLLQSLPLEECPLPAQSGRRTSVWTLVAYSVVPTSLVPTTMVPQFHHGNPDANLAGITALTLEIILICHVWEAYVSWLWF